MTGQEAVPETAQEAVPETGAPEAPLAPGTRRPGGRTARTRAAVRDAVLTGLVEHGYPGLSVEYVAEHSGIHKTTLYRRWGNLEGLVVDALDLAGEDSWAPPDTGSLEGDLRALAHTTADAFTDPAAGAAPTAFIAAAFQSQRAAEALSAFYSERFARCEVIVARGVARGELDQHTNAGALVRAATSPLFFRLFVTREPFDGTLADQAADAALAAARAGVFNTPPTPLISAEPA
ncbi:TetR/AcrR family transcriptional regulator C-terminal ligand-binding domain-containing protein [Streptomyces sp. NPDC048473]|uniref:TetR/AcrR family transcriptional regulator n=1 Tax=unclassified Streptomyces TaxID=2593676 RepID=UPI0037194F26